MEGPLLEIVGCFDDCGLELRLSYLGFAACGSARLATWSSSF